MSKEIVYWKMNNGKSISVDDMDLNHLRNVLKMIITGKTQTGKSFNINQHFKHKESFNLNGDMANVFNDDMEFNIECDATEIDIF